MKQLFLIWSIEHNAWWAPEECGYTLIMAEAGIYTQAESARILERANVPGKWTNECAIPIAALLGTLPSMVLRAGAR